MAHYCGCRANRAVKASEFDRVLVDTAMEEKAAACPIYRRLLEVVRVKLACWAQRTRLVPNLGRTERKALMTETTSISKKASAPRLLSTRSQRCWNRRRRE